MKMKILLLNYTILIKYFVFNSFNLKLKFQQIIRLLFKYTWLENIDYLALIENIFFIFKLIEKNMLQKIL
jgi:hypothetical protein